jgi:hypothetical protein
MSSSSESSEITANASTEGVDRGVGTCKYKSSQQCTTVLQQCYNSVTTVLQQCYKNVTTVLQGLQDRPWERVVC